LRELILHEAADHDLDSAVVVEAVAQVLGLVAAQADARGIGVPCTLDERMATLQDRVKELHTHWLARMQSMPMVGSGRV
jgi:hypothetical protein